MAARSLLALGWGSIVVGTLLVMLALFADVPTGISAVPQSGESWTSTGGPWSASGNVRAFAVDPTAARSAYVVVEAGGINTLYHASDGPATWATLAHFTQTVNSLAASGASLYAGGGDELPAVVGPDRKAKARPDQPALGYSGDGGFTWRVVYTAAVTTTVNSLAANPITATTAYAAAQIGTNGYVLRTSNAIDWTPVLTVPGNISIVAVNPLTPSQVFAGAQNSSTSWAEVYQSNNGGIQWSRVFTSTERLEPFLMVHPVTPTVVFAETRLPGCCPPPPANLWRSDDGGVNWRVVITGGLYGLVFASPDSIYGVNRDVEAIHNASGSTPTLTTVATGVLPEFSNVNAADGRGGHLLYAGLSTGGAYTSADGGLSFHSSNNGIRSYQGPRSIVTDPNTAGTLYSAASGGGFRSANGGTDWTSIFSLSGTRDFAVQPGNPDLLLAGSDHNAAGKPAIYRSADGGLQWTAVYTPAESWLNHYANSLAFDPASPNRAYAAAASTSAAVPSKNSVVRTDDAGVTWTVVMTSSGPGSGLGIVDVSSIGTVYLAGTEGWLGSLSGSVYRSSDHGATWTKVFSQTGRYINGLTIDPQRPGWVYVIDDGNRLWKSSDSGGTWANVFTTTRTLRAIAQDPQASGYLYLGTDGPTVLASSDGGQTWSELAGWGTSLASSQVWSLAVDNGPISRTIYAGLNGVWSRTVAAPPAFDLSVSKGVDMDPPPPGAHMRYRLTFTNTGEISANDVYVTDTIPLSTTYSSYYGYYYAPSYTRLTVSPTITGNHVVWPIGSLSPGGYGYIYPDIQIDNRAALGTVLTNTAEVSGSGFDSNYVNNVSAVSTIVVTPTWDMSLSQTASTPSAEPGSVITYLIAYGNTGNIGASNVVLTDTLPPFVAVTSLSSSSPTAPTVASNQIVWSLGIVPRPGFPTAQGTITVTVRVSDGIPTPAILTNTVNVSTSSLETNLANNLATVAVAVDRATPLSSCQVISPADSGAGTLRQCLLTAAAGDLIAFSTSAFPPTSPATITVYSPLPPMAQGGQTIDASNAGVVLNGGGIVGDPSADGLELVSSGNTIRGLQVRGFPRIGIHLVAGANNNTIGGDATNGTGTAGQGNIIGSNGDAGLYIAGNDNLVTGNRIGTDASGGATLANNAGVLLREGAQGNRIGGTTPGQRNTISGNRTTGVQIMDAGTVSNTVAGNYIGVDVGGSATLSNGGAGISISGASYNSIGGPSPNERNVISGNGSACSSCDGVFITDGAHHNMVEGNFIGTDAGGAIAIGNRSQGVDVYNQAIENVIRDNLIAGNGDNGIAVWNDSERNVVTGNIIGLDASGTVSIGNGGTGVHISGANYNVVGGPTSADGNVISGNGTQCQWCDGVFVGDSSHDNRIENNFIGTDVTGSVALGNRSQGIDIFNQASDNSIRGNVVAANGENGIAIWNGSSRNRLENNLIGTNVSRTASLGNTRDGVWVFGGATDNSIGGSTAAQGNVIWNNGWNGVDVRGMGTTRNRIAINSISGNGSRGIDLAGGGNAELPVPVITSRDLKRGTVSGTACTYCTVEVFSEDDDEGGTYEGSSLANAAGNWSFAKTSPLSGPRVTATATDGQNNTSEFSIAPFIRVQQSHEWVDGQAPQSQVQVQYTLLDSAGRLKGSGSATSNDSGWFGGYGGFQSESGQRADVEPGDVVSVTVSPGYVITTEVVSISGDVDVAADAVFGTVPAGFPGNEVMAEVFEVPRSPGNFKGFLAADHTYSLPLNSYDVREGSMMAIWYRNSQANLVGIVRHWLQIEPSVGGNWVWGNTAPSLAVQITVTTGSGTVKGSAAALADPGGHFGVSPLNAGLAITIVPGDAITAVAGNRTSLLTVPTVTGVMDFDADAVCGVAPPGSQLYLNLAYQSTNWTYRSNWTSVDSSGHYCADVGFDLRPGYQGQVIYYDDRGHRVAMPLTGEDRTVTTLALGSGQQDTVGSLAYRDYSLDITAGERLLLKVTPSTGSSKLWVYGRLGSVPSRTQYDFRTQTPTASGDYDLLIAPTRVGTYYFSVFGWEVGNSGVGWGVGDSGGSYSIVALTLDRRLSDVQPGSAGNSGEVTLLLQGLGFSEGVALELRRAGLPTLAANQVMQGSYTTLSGRFDLRGAAAGTYDVVALWPGGAEETLNGAFTVSATAVGPQLQLSLEVPEFVRPGRAFAASIKYANTGDSDMIAPLVEVTGPVDFRPVPVFTEFTFRLGPQRLGTNLPGPALSLPWRPVYVLGSSSRGLGGTLPPGASGRTPVYFQVPPGTPGHAKLELQLRLLSSDNVSIDWAQVEAEVKPADVDPQVWAVLWPKLTAQIGNTWGDYKRALSNNATYLSSQGRSVVSVLDLFRFEVRKVLGMNPRTVLSASLEASCPAPGLPLEFARLFPGSLEGRFYLGPLGRGWSHSYDVWLEIQSTGDAVVHTPGNLTRSFKRLDAGFVPSDPGDFGSLVESFGGVHLLVEKTGGTYYFRPDHKLDYVVDRNGNRLTATYDGSGQLTRMQHSDGDYLDFTYNAQNRLSRVTDCAGRSTDYSYDSSGEHLVTVSAPGGRVTYYDYLDPTGQPDDHALLAITHPDGRHIYYSYDGLGRLAEEKLDGDAERVTYAYDSSGRIQVTDASANTSIISPDEKARLGGVKDSTGRQLSQSFDSAHNVTSLTDPAGQSYSFDYDRIGNLLAARDALGQSTKLDYDYRFSQISSLQDTRGNRTRFEYDGKGNLTSSTYPDGSREQFSYDSAGNMTRYTARSGTVIAYTYSSSGQLQRKDYPDGAWVDYTYDAAGNMTSASDASGAISMQYDSATNRLTRITYPSGRWFTFAYDAAGRRTQRAGDDGYTLNYEYDSAGRLARLADGTGVEIVRYQYDGAGRVITENKGNGTYTTYDYDAAGRVLHLVNYAPGGSVQSRFDYSYDSNGNATSMTTLDGATSFRYDVLGRLTGVTYPSGRVVTYGYDAAGNRTAVTDDGAITSYTTNNLNQYTQVGPTTYGYDASGNTTAKTDSSGTTTFTYDFDNRLIGVSAPGGDSWQYTYDALGNRVGIDHNGVITTFVHDPIGLVDIAAEYNTGGLVARYVHGLGLVSRVDASGNPAYYAFDATGHTRQVSSGTGATVNVYDYEPFGMPLQTHEAVPNQFRFAGRFGVVAEADGLVHMRARYYSAENGAFLSEDPILIPGDNLRAYARNNPITLVDPSGLSSIGDWAYRFAKRIGLGGLGHTITGSIAGKINRVVGLGLDALETIANLYRAGAIGSDDVKNAGRVLREGYPGMGMWNPEVQELLRREGQGQPLIGETVTSPTGPTELVSAGTTENITSEDPNEKVGPAGTGAERNVRTTDELRYTIFFENRSSASAPAQEVIISDYLDPDLDWTTFRPTEISWGGQVVAVPGNGPEYSGRQTIGDYRSGVSNSWWVDLRASVDYGSGRALWTLRTVDPQTGQLPADVQAGFLPPNDSTGRGDGHVSFSVRPRASLAGGTSLSNRASIVFDTNQPIETNEVVNTTGTIQVVTPVTHTLYLPLVTRGWAGR